MLMTLRRPVRWVAIVALVTPVQLGTARAEEAGEFLVYRHQAGLSRIGSAEVRILVDGSGTVTFSREGGAEERRNIRLTPNEFTALEMLVRAVDFPGAPDEDDTAVTDVGTTTLRIAMGERSRELAFRYRQDLEPLTGFLRKLVYQEFVLANLARREGIHDAVNAVTPRTASGKAMRPSAFEKPLETYARAAEDQHDWLLAVQGLAWVATPEDWMGFLAGELARADADRRPLLVGALASQPFGGNIPDAHAEALCPLFLAEIRPVIPGFRMLPQEARYAYSTATHHLGCHRYTPAIPALVALIRAVSTEEQFGANGSLSEMGGAAIDPLVELLGDPNPGVRASAAATLGVLSRRANDPASPFSGRERAEIARRLGTGVAPKLEILAADDPNMYVRAEAADAVATIRIE